MHHRTPMIVLALTAIALSAANAADSAAVAGIYQKVTESEWGLELVLSASGSATVITKTWIAGNPKAETEKATGTWSLAGDRITVKYGKNVEVLQYVKKLSYEEFGQEGAGPGLRSVSSSSEKSLFKIGGFWRAEDLRALFPD